MPGWSENMVLSIFLFVNESKTEVIVFGPSENSGSRSIDLDYLAPFTSSCTKNLGVFWDQGLKFDKQINAVISSCFFQLRLLSKIKSFLSLKTLEIAIHAAHYNSLGLLQLLYLGISKSSIARLQLVQNAAARFPQGNGIWSCYSNSEIATLVTCTYRIEFKFFFLFLNTINNLAPSYLSDLLYPYNPTRILRSGDQRRLSVPRSRLKYRGDRAFAVAGPRLWNSLPAYIRSAQSLTVFKSSLKTYLFSLAFNLLWAYGMNLWVVLCFMFLFVQHFGQPCLLFLNVLYK